VASWQLTFIATVLRRGRWLTAPESGRALLTVAPLAVTKPSLGPRPSGAVQGISYDLRLHRFAFGVPAPTCKSSCHAHSVSFFVPLALLFGIALGVGQRRKERQGSARPYGVSEYPMVTMEPLLLIQIHRTQSGTNGAFAGSKDRVRQECLGVLPLPLSLRNG
jgi:hypothetical protein